MSLYTAKKVSELVPETAGMIKRASLEQNFPTASREETLISALELEYMIKVAHTQVPMEDAERVCKAVDLYNLGEEVKSHTVTMVKSASTASAGVHETKVSVSQAESFIDSQLLTMQPDLEKIAEASERLWDEYSEYITNDSVKLYAGAGRLVKEAAVQALEHRAKRTGNEEFAKVAQVLTATDTGSLTTEDNRAIISAVRTLEKQAHYIETDLYSDMFLTKEAAVTVSLGSKTVSAEMIKAASTHIGDVLGQDVGNAIASGDTMTVKHMVEALPLGEKQVIAGIV